MKGLAADNTATKLLMVPAKRAYLVPKLREDSLAERLSRDCQHRYAASSHNKGPINMSLDTAFDEMAASLALAASERAVTRAEATSTPKLCSSTSVTF